MNTTVQDLQRRLIALGYRLGEADGIAGPKTERAVRLFQIAEGLAVDGVAGPKTLARLLDKEPKPSSVAGATAVVSRQPKPGAVLVARPAGEFADVLYACQTSQATVPAARPVRGRDQPAELALPIPCAMAKSSPRSQTPCILASSRHWSSVRV